MAITPTPTPHKKQKAGTSLISAGGLVTMRLDPKGIELLLYLDRQCLVFTTAWIGTPLFQDVTILQCPAQTRVSEGLSQSLRIQ
mmetsp:Transcript_58349/g.96693  ORF Transcript_58349/g.96693 Transcript_58349/m.96693 type:complete len:84 (+) Transcript_58349:2378-2629(+)